MRCERCRAEATSTGPGGQRLCDKHYNPTMAAAPGMVGTGTAEPTLADKQALLDWAAAVYGRVTSGS